MVPAGTIPNSCSSFPTFYLRGWMKKQSNVRTQVEKKAHTMIQEEFQKLGPIKYVMWRSMEVGRTLGTHWYLAFSPALGALNFGLPF